jgi:dienelactone hydrolase
MIRSRTFLAVFLALFVGGCAGPAAFTRSDADVVLAEHSIRAPNPANPGPFTVRSLYYGSGTDRRRSVYRDSVTITTQPVDASKLVSLGDSEESRNEYWGFSPGEFPVNGRVWYPEGDGPFPLVVIAHGNHNMKDFSDPGYEYLGELLASRGYVFVSADMNFLNGRIRGENDARGWLFLKHLQAWRRFAATPDGPFFGRINLDQIALIGHSRGGEAVGHAAAFNRLSRYPDDASLEFDFGFGIRSIIAIAPVDGQYLPTGKSVPVTDVNYLVFHGSHDGDVTSFHGLRQYQRVGFTDGAEHFKTAVYVYRANHGQWNTVWNNKDRGPRSGRSLNLRGLIPAPEQRQIGKVYISAFLEATLKSDRRYLPLFRDHRTAGDWLPRTMYVTRFETSSFRALADFEEDIDVTSGSRSGVRILGDSLKEWREDALSLRSRNRSSTSNSQQNQAVWLEWDSDSTSTVPEYRLSIPQDLDPDPEGEGVVTLQFMLALQGGTEDDSLSTPGVARDLSIVLDDSSGVSASLALSRYGAVRSPFDIQILRRGRDSEAFENTWELVLQSYSIPIEDFLIASPGLDVQHLTTLHFRFDRSPRGKIVMDQIGFSRLPEGFFEDRSVR